MNAVTPGSLAEGQEQAVAALRSIARVSDGALTVDLDYEVTGEVLYVRVYLSSASLRSSEQGAQLTAWEPIDIAIPEDFPYTSPIASTGRDDFPAVPHQPGGSRFCVRVEPSNWDPAAGMSGFLRAVIDAYQRIALGTLEGHLQAWRPLVCYRGTGWAVIKAGLRVTAGTEQGTSLRWAAGIRPGENRIDIIEWLDPGEDSDSDTDSDDGRSATDLTNILVGELARISAKTHSAFLIPAVIMANPIALEYFDCWYELLIVLKQQDVDVRRLLAHVALAARVNELHDQPQPDTRKRAALVFRVAADTQAAATDQDFRFAVARLTQDDTRLLSAVSATKCDADSIGQVVEKLLKAPVPWVRVYDGRPESVLRRGAGRPTDKLAGSRILLLGCGGLGAPIADHCVRAGAAGIHIVDSGNVSPGILSRQPYEDSDIGKSKATSLADRLSRIRPEAEVTASVADIVHSDILSASSLGQYDLIIDATANRSVATKIEQSQHEQRNPWPTLVTVAISQQATHGAAAVTPKGAIGAGIDLLRRLGLGTCVNPALRDVYAAFFPPEADRLNFRPDTGCSDTTFIGSTTDISALAAQLLDSALAQLDLRPDAVGTGPPHRSLSIVRLGRDDEPKAARVVLDLPPDRVVTDHAQAYEVRVDETAIETIRSHINGSVNGRTTGAGHTGGLLLGQFDNVCRIAWVSQATGLPPGSSVDPLTIKLDVEEVRNYLDNRSSRSGGMLTLIGFWHTHLSGSAAPGDDDRATMHRLVASPDWRLAQALLLVLGLPEDGSTGEPSSPWAPESHAEIFTT